MGWPWPTRHESRRVIPPETPQNGEYMVAAYTITAAIVAGYWVVLWRKAKKSVSGDSKKRER